MMSRVCTGLFFFLLFVAGLPAFAQVSLTQTNVAYSQDFDSLSSTLITEWIDNSNLPGWYSNRTLYNVGNGSGTTGGLYSFGSAGSSERALGSLAAPSAAPLHYGVRLVNNTGVTITSIDVQYTGEQWRKSTAAVPHQLTVSYLQAASVISITSSGYTAANGLNFVTPIFEGTSIIVLDGNLPENRNAISGTIVVNIPPGEEIMIRWTDIMETGSNHALAIDDLTITPRAAPTAANIYLAGRVTEAGGRGIPNAFVTLSGGPFSVPVITRTSPFGHFRFDGLPVGETYLITVAAKRHVFMDPARTIIPVDSIDDLNFVAGNK